MKYVAAVVPQSGAQRREIRRRSVESSPCAVMFASATPPACSRARERYSPKSTCPIPTTLYRREIYCTVELKIPHKTPSLIVPSEAITFNRAGLGVAVVENGSARIHS